MSDNNAGDGKDLGATRRNQRQLQAVLEIANTVRSPARARQYWLSSLVAVASLALSVYAVTLTIQSLQRDDLSQELSGQVAGCLIVDDLDRQESRLEMVLQTVLTNSGRQPITLMGFRSESAGEVSLPFRWVFLDEASDEPRANTAVYLEPGRAVAVAIAYQSDDQQAALTVERSDGSVAEIGGTFENDPAYPKSVSTAFLSLKEPCKNPDGSLAP